MNKQLQFLIYSIDGTHVNIDPIGAIGAIDAIDAIGKIDAIDAIVETHDRASLHDDNHITP
jgi:hypothetical protein